MEKPPADPELRRRIQELIAYKGGGHNPEDPAPASGQIVSDLHVQGTTAAQAHIWPLSLRVAHIRAENHVCQQ